jgi:PAS domain S-box-containing protein
MNAKKILVVEDEGIVARDIQNRLRHLGYEVPDIAFTGEEAVTLAEKLNPDLILMDIMLNGEMDGIEAALKIRNRMNVPVIYLTAYSDENTLNRAKATDPYNYILKPFNDDDLRIGIDLAFAKHRSELALHDREQWIRTILQSLSSAVVATDTRGNVIFINHAAEKLTGWLHNEALSKPVVDIFVLDETDRIGSISDHIVKLLRNDKIDAIPLSTRIISRLGERCHIRGSCAPIRFEDGKTIGTVIIFTDVKESDIMVGEGIPTPSTTATLSRRAGDPDHTDVNEFPHAELFASPFNDDISDFVRMLAVAPVARKGTRNYIQTFNDFRVKLDNVELELKSWRSKKAVDLLAFLVMKFPRSVHKEILMEYLWPEVDPEVGSRRLHHVVSELRRYLEPNASRYAREQFLLYDHGEYKLSLKGKVIIDHVIFEEVVRAGNRLWARGERDGAQRMYQEALQWKRGDLLPKYLYERDFEEKRELLNQMETQILERIGENKLV